VNDKSLLVELLLQELKAVVVLLETHLCWAKEPELALHLGLSSETVCSFVPRHLEPGYYDQCISLFQAGFSSKVIHKRRARKPKRF